MGDRPTVLVAGASGLVGTAAVEAFHDHGWDVIAVSRRSPELASDRPVRHVPVNLLDDAECRDVFAGMSEVTRVVYAAVYEKPGLVAGWHEQDQMQTNLAMLRNLMEPLSAAAALQHVSLVQGTKAYGVHRHPVPIPARERFPRDDHPNFYWLQEDYIRDASERRGFAWTIMRPQVVAGPNYGVAMNLPPVIGAFAAICREEGRPFGFPGGPRFPLEAVDARLVGSALRWAAEAPEATGQHFNLSNGEAFSWPDLWPALAQHLGMAPAPDGPLSIAKFLPAKSHVWDAIVRKYDLRPLALGQLLGESHYYADFCFACGAAEPPPPALVSTVKITQAGFTDTCDTEEMFRHWLDVLIERRVLPPPG